MDLDALLTLAAIRFGEKCIVVYATTFVVGNPPCSVQERLRILLRATVYRNRASGQNLTKAVWDFHRTIHVYFAPVKCLIKI